MAEDVMEQTERNHHKMRRGYVVSDRMEKTIVVRLEDCKKYPLYGKAMRKTKKVKVHDEHNATGTGDLVVIMETRSLSATKRWRLVEIVEKARQAIEGSQALIFAPVKQTFLLGKGKRFETSVPNRFPVFSLASAVVAKSNRGI